MKKYVRTVKQCKRELTKTVRTERAEYELREEKIWLCDNAALLLNSLNAFLKYTSAHPEVFLDRLFAECEKAASALTTADSESIRSRFLPLNLSLDECEALIPALRAAFACAAIKQNAPADRTGQWITFIRALSDITPEELFPVLNETEKLLCRDPAGLYSVMSAYSKSEYRKAVKKLAKREGVTEKEAAAGALQQAREAVNGKSNHIGFYLPVTEKKKLAPFYLISEALVTLLICAVGAFAADRLYVFFLLLFPAAAFVRCLSGITAPLLFPAGQMLSLNEEAEGLYLPGALITVSSLLPEARDASGEYAHFAALRAADSSQDTAVFALYDLKNSAEPFVPSDKADINAVKEVFDRLNSDFGGGFIMAVRDRVYAPTEKEYTGYERKRGAVRALVKLLTDGKNAFSVLYGDTAALNDKKYILALDSDTELGFETLRRLKCIACHPLNAPEFDKSKRRIVSGYGCIAPRTETSLASSCKTLFSTLFTMGGAAAYAPAVSERYMDMFSTSLFTGKGLIDVRAYADVCAEAFEPGRILSHDIPEGALLRTGFAGNAVLTDSFPSSPASYFRRAERWIRGDIQNIPLIFRGTSRSKTSAALPPLAGYQLADNIRFALTPVFCTVCLLTAAFADARTGILLTAAAVLGIAGEGLISCVWSVLSGGIGSLMRTFYSSSVSQSLRSLLRAAVMLGTLPLNAAVSALAITRAVYRMTVSKKHTLQWTTASAAEKRGRIKPVSALLFPLCCGILLLGARHFTMPVGFVILLCLPFSLSDGIKLKNRQNRIHDASREVLSSYMASMWDFFAENVKESENHLPPDNIQETPVRRTAHRTSPTNIGLYLVSILAAADLSLISSDEMYRRISATFGVLGGLMKYKGLLYNWYDTRTLAPLKPLFISTVDCGNYEVCLTALKEGLKEYARSDPRFSALADAADSLLGSGDMTLLFNKKRGLFSIGLDVSENKLSDSFYDLFMSEAVMTSYYHIAKRDIPVSHWAKLDRPLVKAGRYTAAVSWSGTMFEYFMPSLFLPVYENSFRYEALKVCLREQKRFSGKKYPYGVSESGYYAFDPALSYRYRANGIRSLALKRGADCERIFSPYSAFLSLSADIPAAISDLSHFASLHALGRYGFYEAVDFSTGTNVRQDYMLVRSYMAHHVGMSMIACANAVNDNIFVKRFMRDRDMLSADSLLHEKLPFDSVPSPQLFTSREKKEETPPRSSERQSVSGSTAAVFSNGEDSLICNTKGEFYFLHSSLSVFGFSERSKGVFVGIRTDGKNVQPVMAPEASLKAACCYSEREIDGLTVKCAPALLNNFSALAIPVKIKNNREKTARFSLFFYFEPDMRPPFSGSTHPLFDALMIRPAYDKRVNALTFEQKNAAAPRLAAAAGFYDHSTFYYECDREKALGRSCFAGHPFSEPVPDFTDNLFCAYPCAAIRLDLTLSPGKSIEKVLLCAAEESAGRALSLLARIRLTKLPDIRKTAAGLLGNLPYSAALPEKFAACVYFGENSAERRAAAQENELPVSALWQAGISGDLPLITAAADGLPENAADSFIRLHNALSVTGSANDLVFLTSFRGDYQNDIPEKLAACIRRADLMQRIGQKGGIHILRTSEYGDGMIKLLKAMSGVFFPCENDTDPPSAETQSAEKNEENILKSLPAGTAENCFVPCGYHIGTKPERPWCHTLSNRSFGTLVSDSSLGYTWALNSRQNKLTPWNNDTRREHYGERLLIGCRDKIYDALSGADVTFYDDKAVYTSLCGETEVRVTVQTDARAMKKRIKIKLSRASQKTDNIRVTYSLLPQLAEHEKLADFVRQIPTDGCVVLTNPANTDYAGFAGLGADRAFESEVGNGCCKLTVTAFAEDEICFYAVFSRSYRGVKKLLSLPFREPLPQRVRFTSFSKEVNAFGSALLLHNVTDTRFQARTGLYQCSGAYGYRDQLQDVSALLEYDPQAVKLHILRSCAVQFREGDVLHWYHTTVTPRPAFKGVRTHCSDDMLWLPLTVARYIKHTGDLSLLDTPVAFLEGEPLAPEERERFSDYRPSSSFAGVYEHCLRAIKHSFMFGEHSLPLIKAGDWNDSFSEVGKDFRGESVWLAQFLRLVCLKFIPVCGIKNDKASALLFLNTADKMKEAVLKYGFNGKYFIRGYYDNGSKLGDAGSEECVIDLLPQAFAVLSDIADDKKTASALLCAWRSLFDKESNTMKLFTPPFGEHGARAGYVNDYPEGVRENGGQYTHAAVWFALALLKAGYKKEALRLCELLCPAVRYRTAEEGRRFMNEPYAMTGDICTGEGIQGRGGWSLYTGSAGWYLRLLREFESPSASEI